MNFGNVFGIFGKDPGSRLQLLMGMRTMRASARGKDRQRNGRSGMVQRSGISAMFAVFLEGFVPRITGMAGMRWKFSGRERAPAKSAPARSASRSDAGWKDTMKEMGPDRLSPDSAWRAWRPWRETDFRQGAKPTEAPRP